MQCHRLLGFQCCGLINGASKIILFSPSFQIHIKAYVFWYGIAAIAQLLFLLTMVDVWYFGS